MFEVNFDENIELEKNINNSKNNPKSIKKYGVSMLINSLVVMIATFVNLMVGYNIMPIAIILRSLSLVVAGAGIHCFVVNAIKIIKTQIAKNRKKESLKKLDNVSEKLNINSINTNSKELTNSVIIENSYTDIKEVNEDGIVTVDEKITKDKFFLFLDNDSNTCGMLEQKIETTKNDETNSELKYYILEKEDLEKIENKVVRVRKLVKKSNNK